MEKPRLKQIHLRFYRDNPLHAPFFDWLETMSEDGRGVRLHGLAEKIFLDCLEAGMLKEGTGEKITITRPDKKKKNTEKKPPARVMDIPAEDLEQRDKEKGLSSDPPIPEQASPPPVVGEEGKKKIRDIARDIKFD